MVLGNAELAKACHAESEDSCERRASLRLFGMGAGRSGMKKKFDIQGGCMREVRTVSLQGGRSPVTVCKVSTQFQQDCKVIMRCSNLLPHIEAPTLYCTVKA